MQWGRNVFLLLRRYKTTSNYFSMENLIPPVEVREKMTVRNAGIIVIGDEVLKGQVVDSNIVFLAKKLHSLGIKLCKVSVIPDEVSEIAKEVAEFSTKYDQVITTGGIGPTHDDVSYEGVAAAFSQPLMTNQDLVQYWSWFNGDPSGSSRKQSAVKMATIPRDSKIIYTNLPSPLIPGGKFPVITVNNVCILPGLPKYLRAIFNSLEGTYFRNSGVKFHVRRCYLSVFESVFTDGLNEAVKKYSDITFGSYPKLNNPYYKTVVTLESLDKNRLDEGFNYFKSKLKKDWIAEHGSQLGDAWIRIEEFVDSRSPGMTSLTKNLSKSVEVLDKCLADYNPSDIFISFNGGKDCTALLHLVHSLMIKKYEATLPKLNAIYIRPEESFKEVEDFINETTTRYKLNLIKAEGPLKNSLQEVLKKHPFKVALLGTRKSDPAGAELSHVQKTDEGWGNLIRISPLLNWSYKDIWAYLREFDVPYCSLYNKGYSSLGSKKNSRPNPALEYLDEDGTVKYKPAYYLENECMERAGRE